MGTDLYKPLGQNRPAGRKPGPRLSRYSFLAVGAATLVIALSVYTMRGETVLERNDLQAATVSLPEQVTSEKQPEVEAAGQFDRVDPRSGANVERTLTDDGTVVTKFSPRSRDGNGPVLVETPRLGQDPRLAGTPNPNLLEDSPYGALPIVGPDGLRPMDQYARPWSGARGTRIAIVVSGLGLSQTGTQKAIEQLPEEVTLAFAASGNSLQRWMQTSRRQGHEILIQVPMEPFGVSEPEADATMLLSSLPVAENLARLHEAMGKITGYTGIMNYQGARLLSNAEALEPVLRDVASRGLLFLDDGSSARSTTAGIAQAIELPHSFADLTLDTQLEGSAILRKLDDLERLALRKGSAVGVASAFDESIDAIRQWIEEASARGIEIVGVSALADNPLRDEKSLR
ncbi:divergent polysaccharide deacetylase family protein [Rhizobium halophilum]|uniref:divergent polysaccharide deacetylase family protein n=1 Tax=Rhizobium halophilum TaxID=2846852 RepID=UPI001EFCD2FE|nr:divergent polysaccharide deacetylase family protein [Rhizobium halophilum]MCF6370206.1 divergent polysaccharide deacetylase family protein [Rhizobium halophilum]